MRRVWLYFTALALIVALFTATACTKPDEPDNPSEPTETRYEYALSFTEVTLTSGESAVLSVTVSPSKKISPVYESGNSAVATVNSDGLVTAVGGGQTEITVTVDGKVLKCSVTVEVRRITYTVSGVISDIHGAVSNVSVSLGDATTTTDEKGKYALMYTTDEQLANSIPSLIFTKDGYESVETDMAGKLGKDCVNAVVSAKLIRTPVLVGKTKDGRFTLSATRSERGLHVIVDCLDSEWYDNPSNVYVVYFSTKDNQFLNENSYVLKHLASGHMYLHDRGSRHRSYDTTDIKVTISEKDGAKRVEYVIPTSKFGLEQDEVIGLSMTTTENSTAGTLISAVDQSVVVCQMPTSYVRVDSCNRVFASEYNVVPEEAPVLPYDKSELIKDKPIRFALKGVAHKDADDIWLGVKKTTGSFVFDMVGFGDWTENELIRITLHTSKTDGRAWALQQTDLVILCDKNTARFKTGIVSSFDFITTSAGMPLLNQPEFAQYDGYFTYRVTVKFSEIPGYSEDGELSAMFMEVLANSNEFYNVNWWIGSINNGVICGDNAMQENYIVIQ